MFQIIEHMLPLLSGREVQLDFLQDCKAGDVQAQGMKEVVMTAQWDWGFCWNWLLSVANSVAIVCSVQFSFLDLLAEVEEVKIKFVDVKVT